MVIDAYGGDEIETRIFERQAIFAGLMSDLKLGARLQHAFGRIAARRRLEVTMSSAQQIALPAPGVQPAKIRSAHSDLLVKLPNDLNLSFEEKLIGACKLHAQRITKQVLISGGICVELGWLRLGFLHVQVADGGGLFFCG